MRYGHRMTKTKDEEGAKVIEGHKAEPGWEGVLPHGGGARYIESGVAVRVSDSPTHDCMFALLTISTTEAWLHPLNSAEPKLHHQTSDTKMAQAPQDVKSYQHEEAYDVNWLRVDDVHELYYRQFGKKDGKSGKTFSNSGLCSVAHVVQ
jgi:hypothetical protein